MRLRDAAFGAHPDANVHGAARSADPRRRWLAGVVLGGQGSYAAAATALAPLVRGHDSAPLFASLAASTLASHYRQVGCHGPARDLDARALALVLGAQVSGEADPDDVDVVGAELDARLGLAADELGLGRLALARRLHARAEEAFRERPLGWRGRLRLRWVAAELALAGDDPERALNEAQKGFHLLRTLDSLRHHLKTEIVLGVALNTLGSSESVPLLQKVVARTCELRLASLTWPGALVLATAVPAERERWNELARHALSHVIGHADTGKRRLIPASPWLPSWLLRSSDRSATNEWTNFLTDKAPDRVKVRLEASDRDVERHSAVGRGSRDDGPDL
ncbi:hypothetical protein GCM10022247_20910 [Allokutzneria multivorans]|uniref:Uncharacterized protein n=1 Tax=Allokutzneria multivorans TaxID=1142134 RepID=A0ABP7RP79_9PSEU